MILFLCLPAWLVGNAVLVMIHPLFCGFWALQGTRTRRREEEGGNVPGGWTMEAHSQHSSSCHHWILALKIIMKVRKTLFKRRLTGTRGSQDLWLRGKMTGSVDGNLQRGDIMSGGILANWLNRILAEDGPGWWDTKDGGEEFAQMQRIVLSVGVLSKRPTRILAKSEQCQSNKDKP